MAIKVLAKLTTIAATFLMGASLSHAHPKNTFTQQIVQGPPIALVGGNVVDVVSGKILPNYTIVVESNYIKAIGPAAEVTIPENAKTIDMNGKWLMPGLMNMHVHFGLQLPGAAGAALVSETDPQLALRMAENAYKSLYSGVTYVRLVSEKHGVDFALKSAINRGAIPGPHIETVGEAIVPTGGHGYREADGPYGFAEAVRDQIKQGATWIKIAISGGISDSLGSISSAPMTDEELATTMEVAHRNNVMVTAHNGSPQAALQALKYGINGFEHGYHLTDEVLKIMKEKQAYLVPTIVVSQNGAMEFFEKIGSPEWYLARVKSVGSDHWRVLQSAIKIGVPIALGTDQFPYEPNEGTTATVREAELYVEAGMKPIEALRSATIGAARMLKVTDQYGSLEVGKYADIVALEENPISNIRALRTLNFVMKSGRVYRDDIRSPLIN